MELKIELRFIYAEHRKAMYLADYNSGISSGGNPLSLNDFDKTSHALKVLNDEFEAAMMRANERLLADGFGEFKIPHMRKTCAESI